MKVSPITLLVELPDGVFVDQVVPCVPNPNWPFHESCHMFSLDLGKLHQVAAFIGLKRSWFQDTSLPHYDLVPSKRTQAIQAGVVECDRFMVARFTHLKRILDNYSRLQEILKHQNETQTH